MSTIYGVTFGEYSDYGVGPLFESYEEALAYAPDSRIEEFTFVPKGTVIKQWERLQITWWEKQWAGSLPPGPKEMKIACDSISDEPLRRPSVSRDVTGHGGFLQVTGDDFERTRKVFTEQLAGFKLELPLLKAKTG